MAAAQTAKSAALTKLMDLAQWAAANALGKPESEWLMNGRDAEYLDFVEV
jgi:hypothetical protein